MKPLDRYVNLVTLCGIGLLAWVLTGHLGDIGRDADLEFWLLFGCVVGGELVPIKVMRRGSEGEITTSTTFAFALMLSHGLGAAVLAQAVASIVSDLHGRKAMRKAVFNVSQFVIALVASGMVLRLLSDVPHPGREQFLAADLPAMILAGGVFFLVNTLLVAAVIAMVQSISVWRYFSSDWLFQASNTGMLLGLAPVVVLTVNQSALYLPLVALPLVAVYRGGRQAMLNERQAIHDALTGLPNRVLLLERVEQSVRLAARDGTNLAVMLMDLDHFKEVNDTLGHHHGDLLLREIGPRLQGVLRDSDTVARLGGDEFAVLLSHVSGPAEAAEVARKMLEALERPLAVQGLTLEIGASIGIAVYPTHGETVDTLIQRADIAMYQAKAGRTGHELYLPEQDDHTPRRLTLASQLRRALEQDEFILHYQPKVDMRLGAVRGVEALLRWEHPTRGIVLPTEFIPLAEQTGLILPVTAHVLNTALGQVREWRSRGVELTVAVNLSARSLLDQQLPEAVGQLLRRWRLEPETLELEITESMLMTDPTRAALVLDRLTDMGVRLAVDDFGTGYSSLAHLRRLPVSEIKIDKSFVINMAMDRNDATIVRSTIDLAHNLGLTVIAEGVESEAVWHQLRELGCDLAQGYYLSRALPGEELLAWVETMAPRLAGQAALPDAAGRLAARQHLLALEGGRAAHRPGTAG